MRRTLTIIAKTATVLVGAAGFFFVSFAPNAQPAWAPTMLGDTIERLRAAGYEVCEPTVSQRPGDIEETGVYAEAVAPPMFGTCAIRFTTGFDLTQLDWVAWHEACHLASMNRIHADPAHGEMEDPYHEHPLFLDCLDLGPADRGGY